MYLSNFASVKEDPIRLNFDIKCFNFKYFTFSVKKVVKNYQNMVLKSLFIL